MPNAPNEPDANVGILDEWIVDNRHSHAAPAVYCVADWLRNDATPDDWHRAVTALNWSYGTQPFLWIFRQPQCGKATALTAFFWARPGQYLNESDDLSEVDDWKIEYLVLIREVRVRFMAGYYTRSEIAFDAGLALADEAYLPCNPPGDRLDLVIPPAMRVSLAGRAVSDRIDEFDSRPLLWPR